MIKLGIVMDPIMSINFKKDTSFAMLLEAQRRDWELYYMEMKDLYLHANEGRASMKRLSVKDSQDSWYSFLAEQDLALHDLDVILMRKDPPFNIEYIYITYILECAEAKGVLVVNKPQSLRDSNEKLFTTCFPELIPSTLVSCNTEKIRHFHQQHGDIILKPLDRMGGASIFRVQQKDPNLSVIIETMTKNGTQFCIAQSFLPAIQEGDKRILVIDGEPIPYCLARIPAHGETRGNLSAGGHYEARPLSKSDWKIADLVAPKLKEKELIFAGLDVIGDRLTEINVTSPTCVREIEASFSIPITGMLMEAIERRLLLK
ncbi:glutathione synthetase [Serratia symbiotica str. 'Cinara cedri']|nr:glutathione synthetase [Serratia symbiotica str. 'Cinara cedri']